MKRFYSLAAACLFAAAPAAFAGPDEDYISIYQMLEDGDQLVANRQEDQARAKFEAAQDALKKFKATYPFWNQSTVDFRLQYVQERLGKLGPAKTPAAVTAPAPAKAAPVDPTEELRNQLAQVQEQNKVLNAKLQEALAAQPAAVDPRELQKAEARIASLQKEKELLRVAVEQEQAKAAKASDKSGLEAAQKEIANLRGQLAAQAAPSTATERELAVLRDSAQTNALAVTALKLALEQARQERDAALAKASAPSSKPVSQPSPTAPAAPTMRASDAGVPLETARQIAMLRARIDVLEAQKIPYTADELAAMKQGPLATRTAAAKPTRKELPAGAGVIIQEAQRAFAAKKYDEAEKKYQEVLKLDDRNVFTLGNLGLIQMEAGRLNEAEATLMKANEIEPNDPFVLTHLGILRFRQRKFDEAIDLLSRSVDIDPKNAQTQSFLGLALNEKGLRGPGEAALRRALELNPNYADAHHNLAVVYASQNPPFIELARFHYNKARDLGQPTDPAIEKMLAKKQ